MPSSAAASMLLVFPSPPFPKTEKEKIPPQSTPGGDKPGATLQEEGLSQGSSSSGSTPLSADREAAAVSPGSIATICPHKHKVQAVTAAAWV